MPLFLFDGLARLTCRIVSSRLLLVPSASIYIRPSSSIRDQGSAKEGQVRACRPALVASLRRSWSAPPAVGPAGTLLIRFEGCALSPPPAGTPSDKRHRSHAPQAGQTSRQSPIPSGCIPNMGAVYGAGWHGPRSRGHAHRQHAHASVGMPPKMARTHPRGATIECTATVTDPNRTSVRHPGRAERSRAKLFSVESLIPAAPGGNPCAHPKQLNRPFAPHLRSSIGEQASVTVFC